MAEGSAAWLALRGFMASTCGVTLGEDQHYLMEARLAPVAKALNYATTEAYVQAALRPGAPKAVTSPLIDAMTTHETYFFRDPPFWKSFVNEVLPALDVRAGHKPLRIWCAACSSGQEAYSLAIALDEASPTLLERTTIVATDVSEAVLSQAKRGVFNHFEVSRGLTAPRLVKYFTPVGADFAVQERLKRPILWATHNLLTQAPPTSNVDLVLVRNVLIYFTETNRKIALSRLQGSVRKGGFLGLGGAERLPGQPHTTGWYAV